MTDSGSTTPAQDSLPRWVPAVVFAVLTIIAFRAYLFSPAGSMLVGQDTIAAGVMMRSFFVEQFHAIGRLPLWNPYMYGGVPTIEAGSGDILYPLSFALHMLLPMVTALAWKLILHVFIAGFSMYACARAFGARRVVALFVGVGWMFSANLVSLVYGGQDGKLYVIALFPGALALLVRALERPTWLRYTWFGAIAALMLIAHPQLAFYAWVALGFYALASIVGRRKEGSKALSLRIGGGVLSLAVALGACALVLLPMYVYLKDVSPRAGGDGIGFDKAASYSLNAEELVNFVVPDFSGVDESYWGRNPLKHNVEYGGAIIFVLGIAGLIALKGDPRRIGLGIAAGVSLLYALGANTPIFSLMYHTIPGLKRFRAPSLATFVALTAISVLAVLLLERILRDRESREGRIAGRVLAAFAGLCLLLGIVAQVGGVGGLSAWFSIFGQTPRAQVLEAASPGIAMGAILAALWLAIAWGALFAWRSGLLGATGFVLILTGATAADALRVDARYVQVVPFEQFFPEDGGFQTLKQQLGPGERVLAIASSYLFSSGGPEGGYLATYDIPEIFGYHSNQLRWYDQLTRRDVRDRSSDPGAYYIPFLESPLLRALSGRIILTPVPMENISGFQTMGGNQRLTVYRNSEALPGAVVVPRVTVEPDSTRLIERMWTKGLDPAAEAFVAAPIAAIGTGGGTGDARIVHDGADSVSVEATTTGPALLLLTRTFHPAWRTQVNGQPVEAVRTDHALIGVPLPAAGTHKIELAYRPPMVARARLITFATWFLVIGATIVTWGLGFKRRKDAHG